MRAKPRDSRSKQKGSILSLERDPEDTFDDLNALPFQEIDRQRSKGQRRDSSRFVREDRRVNPTTASGNVREQWHVFDWRRALRVLIRYAEPVLFNRSSRRLAVHFLVFGLTLCWALETYGISFQYNSVILLALSASCLFPFFPRESIRPQLCLSVATMTSFAVDVFKLCTSTLLQSRSCVALIVLIMTCKLAVLFAFLYSTQSAPRTRKYLDRRLRAFLPPLRVPKRIMRDIRSRCLALLVLHLFLAVSFCILFLVLVFRFDYSLLLLSSANSLPIFLAGKSASSLLISLALLYDTDVRLCLAHFGCGIFCPDRWIRYLQQQRIALGGWPHVFSFSGLRMYLLSFLKLLDVLWGCWGWVLLGRDFFTESHLESSLSAVLSFVTICCLLSDLWCSMLFFAIRYLRRRMHLLEEVHMLPDSDDSEIEEMNLRTSLNDELQRQSLVAQRREQQFEEYVLHGLRDADVEEGSALLPDDKLKLEETRKPSRAGNVRVKGGKKKSSKKNLVLPEPSSSAPDNSSGGRMYYGDWSQRDSDDEDNGISNELTNERQRLLNVPVGHRGSRDRMTEDNTFDSALSPLHSVPVEHDMRAMKTERRISPIEFSELWDLFSVKQDSHRYFAALHSSSRYFMQCLDLSLSQQSQMQRNGGFEKLSSTEQRGHLLRSLAGHLPLVHAQLVSASIYREQEISVLCAAWLSSEQLILFDIKILSVNDFRSTAEGVAFFAKHSLSPHAKWVIRCIVRSPSLETSQKGFRMLLLDRIFSFVSNTV